MTMACSQQPKIKQHLQRDLDTVRGMKWGQEADVDIIIEQEDERREGEEVSRDRRAGGLESEQMQM